MNKNSSAPLRYILLFALLLGAAACKPQFTGTWRSSSDVNVNGVRKSKRVNDGVTRRLETNRKVTIKDGTITNFAPDVLIKMEETGSPKARIAELRQNGVQLELWIEEKDSFRRGTAEDEAWLKSFLGDFASK